MSVPGRKSSVTRTVSNSSPLALCAVEKTISARKKTKTKINKGRNENTSEDAKASLDKRSCVAKGIVTVAGKLCQQMY